MTLADHLTPETIDLQVAAVGWEAAIAAAGHLLVKAGRSTPRYTRAMIDAVCTAGPYIVFAPGVALAHARPEDGALAPGLSLVTLRTPVEFGSGANDPVSLVFAFCGDGGAGHVGLLATLARFIDDAGRCRQLARARAMVDVMQLLHDFEADKGTTP